MMKGFFSFCIVSMALLIGGCSPPVLSVRLDGVTPASLASYHVGSVDPLLCCFLGQRLTICWAVEDFLPKYRCLELLLTIRLRDHTQEQQRVAIEQLRGRYIYELLGDKYQDSGGIQVYKVELWGDGCLVASAKHLLWCEWIDIGEK